MKQTIKALSFWLAMAILAAVMVGVSVYVALGKMSLDTAFFGGGAAILVLALVASFTGRRSDAGTSRQGN